jgi:hypothetical protein
VETRFVIAQEQGRVDGQTIGFVEAFYQSHASKLYNYNLYVNLSKVAIARYLERLIIRDCR